MLDEFEDASIYQTWSYGAVRWGERNLSHLLLRLDGKVLAMAQLRIARPTALRYGIAHLRWGPLCHLRHSCLNPEVVGRIATALYDEYVVKRRLFLRVLLNGCQETERGQVFQSAFSRYESESFGPGDSYRTIILDLQPPLDTLRKQLDQKWRNQLNRAEKNGLTIQDDNAPDRFDTFVRLYDEMMARKQFEGASDVLGFERMQKVLPASQRMKVLICEQDGVPLAGLVAATVGNMGIYLLGATNELGMKSKGAYLLQWQMIQWLKAKGVKYYNLGGINPEKNPGVFHFKSGFSGRDSRYLPPLIACNSIGSRVLAKAAGLARGEMRGALNRLLKRS